jgi:amidase
VDPALWQPASFIVEPREDFRKQSDDAFNAAVEMIKAGGAKVAEQVPLPTIRQIFENGVDGVDDTFPLMLGDFKKQFNEFLKGFDNFEIKTLEDLIRWNEEHSDEALPEEFPSQSVLIDAQKDEMSRDDFDAAVRHMRKHARDPIMKALEENGVDMIVGPADGRIASTAACAGYPVATVPLGFADFNGRAFGLNIVAPSNSEEKILAFMSAWEKTFPGGRAAPPLLVNWVSSADDTAHL